MTSIESELNEFLTTLKNTTSCCFNTPTKLVRYDTGRSDDLKYEELLVCDEHFKLKPFQSGVVKIIDLTPIYQAQPPEVQKDLT